MYQPAYPSPRPPSRRAAAVASRIPAVLAAAGFGLVVRHVLTHDPGRGLSARGWVTIALAALVPVLLRARRRPRRPSRAPLIRAVSEYATVALLAALLMAPPATTAPVKVSAPATADRPAEQSALVGVLAGARTALAELERQAKGGR